MKNRWILFAALACGLCAATHAFAADAPETQSEFRHHRR